MRFKFFKEQNKFILSWFLILWNCYNYFISLCVWGPREGRELSVFSVKADIEMVDKCSSIKHKTDFYWGYKCSWAVQLHSVVVPQRGHYLIEDIIHGCWADSCLQISRSWDTVLCCCQTCCLNELSVLPSQTLCSRIKTVSNPVMFSFFGLICGQ